MLGIIKSLSSTRPFWAPITIGNLHSLVSIPPEISLEHFTLSEFISRLTQFVVKL